MSGVDGFFGGWSQAQSDQDQHALSQMKLQEGQLELDEAPLRQQALGLDVQAKKFALDQAQEQAKRQSAADDERSALYQEARNRFSQVFF